MKITGDDGKEYQIEPNADLSLADLSNARLKGADLSEAYLEGADLTGANLSGTNSNSSRVIFLDTSIDTILAITVLPPIKSCCSRWVRRKGLGVPEASPH